MLVSYIKNLRKKIGHETLIMPCACLLIEDGYGNLLLQQRADDGKWSHHGGAIEIDESVDDALRREVKEELNLELDELSLFGIYSGAAYHHTYPNGDETSCIDIVYLCSKFHGEIKLQEDEVLQIKWFNQANLPHNISDNARQAIVDYFDKKNIL